MLRRRARSAAGSAMISVEVSNRSGVKVDEEAAAELARSVLAGEGVEDGELGLHFVGPEEMRTLKRDHLGRDEVTDVLSFPIDGHEELAPAAVLMLATRTAPAASSVRHSSMPLVPSLALK